MTGLYKSPNEEFNVLLIEFVVGNEGNAFNMLFCFAEFLTELDGLKKLDTSDGILRLLLFAGNTDVFFPFIFLPLNGFILFINSNNMIMIDNIIILYKINWTYTI